MVWAVGTALASTYGVASGPPEGLVVAWRVGRGLGYWPWMARLCGGGAGFELDGESTSSAWARRSSTGRWDCAAGFESGDGGLGHAGGGGELGLAPAVAFPKFPDGAPEFVGEAGGVVLLGGAGFGHPAVA